MPALGDRLAIVVADHLEERSTDEFVDRPPGQQRRTLIRRLDHAAVVQTHHRVGQIVEEASDLRLRPRQLVDRVMEAPTDPAGLEQGRHDRDDRQHPDAGDDGDRAGPGSDPARSPARTTSAADTATTGRTSHHAR